MTFLPKSLIELLLILLLLLEHGGLEGWVPDQVLSDVRLACALLIISLVKLSWSRPGILLVEPH